MVSRSMVSPVVTRIFSTASFMIESVFRPRKSILIRPVDSITWPSYWVQRNLCPGSFLSSATETGTQSLILSRQIMNPQACMPVPRTVPSSIFAYSMVLCSFGSGLASASRSSGIHFMALPRFIFKPSGNLSGISLQSQFAFSRGSFSTRATSLIEFFVAMVP